ncbi:MAG: pimeloyl-ACP methyl ester carboxylesterase [Myxococcota bacterium]|jgi:pimeloyl-ACP methyl ester carboxylesterase
MVTSKLQSLYPWQGKTLAVDGGNLNYLDEGPRDGEVILAVHGNPTWSFYWRRLITTYGDRYRVVVPDHIGCGLSDKPQDWPYQLAGHRDNLVALIEHLDLRDITLVVHDWGGAIGMAAAAKLPDRIRRLVITNTAAFRSQTIPASIASCRIPLFGSLAVRGFNGFARVATWRATAVGLSPEVRDGLLMPYNSWANRIATLRFVEDIPLKSAHPSYATLTEVEEGLAQFTDRPMLICWGDDDFCFTPEFRREWETRFPDAEVHAWADVGHYVMEDAPDRLIEKMDDFLARHPLESA